MSHRLMVHWNQWLHHRLGRLVLEEERKIFEKFLTKTYGKHVVLIGVPEQEVLIKALEYPCPLLLTPLYKKTESELRSIESSFYELPIATASVDAVLLPHTLELVDNPRQLLVEACRIVKPEGYLLLSGFNPYSFWGLKKSIEKRSEGLPLHHLLQPGTINRWLSLSDFELLQQASLLYRPPLENKLLLKRLAFLEWLGPKVHLPCGGAYALMAKAKVIALTPIRLRWKQSLATAGMRIPSSLPGPTIRNR